MEFRCAEPSYVYEENSIAPHLEIQCQKNHTIRVERVIISYKVVDKSRHDRHKETLSSALCAI